MKEGWEPSWQQGTARRSVPGWASVQCLFGLYRKSIHISQGYNRNFGIATSMPHHGSLGGCSSPWAAHTHSFHRHTQWCYVGTNFPRCLGKCGALAASSLGWHTSGQCKTHRAAFAIANLTSSKKIQRWTSSFLLGKDGIVPGAK